MPTNYDMRKAALEQAEQTLRSHMAQEHGSPFIGHHDIPEPVQSAAKRALVTEIGGKIDAFLDYVTVQYPLVAVWAVATTLAKQYDPATDYASYGPISRRLGMEIPTDRRGSFNDRFRRACNAHGLILPPKYPGRQDLIGDYLFQAGVPHSQLYQLVDAFLRVERKSGLPDWEDTAEVKSWEQQAVESVPVRFTRLRKILGEDSTGYHATAYVRLREGTNQPTTDFERRVLDEIRALNKGHRLGSRPPRLTFSDGELRIEAAPRGQSIEVAVDNQPSRLLNPQETRVLSPPWPRHVRWRAGTQQNDWQSLSLFSDPADILLFDGESGTLKGVLNLVRSVPHVPAGSISLLSMQPFRTNGEDAYQLGQSAYVLYPEPSTALFINQGDAVYTAPVDPRLRLEVDGCRVARHAEGLLLAEPRTVFLRGDTSGMNDNLEIKLEYGMHHISRTSVRMRPGGDLLAPLNLPSYGPFAKVRISLHVKSQNRALNRYGFWYWPSLRGLCDRAVFDADSIPENLAKEHLMNVTMTDDGRLTLQKYGPPYLRAILAFSVDQRVVSFTFLPPGVSMFCRTSTGEEFPLSIGARLQIKKDQYASHLIVRCPDQPADMDLDFKGSMVRQPFDSFGLWRKSFAMLAIQGRYNAIRLLPRKRPQAVVDLVLIEPARVTRIVNSPKLRAPQPTDFAYTRTWLTRRGPRYFALAVVGNRDGRVGYGLGEDISPGLATKRVMMSATHTVAVPRRGSTILRAVVGCFDRTTVRLEPAGPSTGIVAGGPARAVLQAVMYAAGIRDVIIKFSGPQTTVNAVRAVFVGFGVLRKRQNREKYNRVIDDDLSAARRRRTAGPWRRDC